MFAKSNKSEIPRYVLKLKRKAAAPTKFPLNIG